MFHIIPSSALSISSCGSVRVFVRAAQHIPVAVRTMMVVEPGKLPLCHRLPEPTIQPRAYLAAEVLGKTGLGVVMTWMVCRFQNAGDRPRAAHVVEKLNQRRGSCQPSAVRVHAGNVYFVRVLIVLPEVHNFVGCALLQAVSRNAHAADAARRQDRALHVDWHRVGQSPVR